MKRPVAIDHSHFNVGAEATPERQVLAWRTRVGHVMDMPVTLAQMAQPFSAAIDRYIVGDMVFTDSRTDPLTLVRSIARISTDNVRDIAFRVFLEGEVRFAGSGRAAAGSADPAPPRGTILALDMDQPLRLQVGACRVLTFFVPRARVENSIADAATLHGRVLTPGAPLARMLTAHVAALAARVGAMDTAEVGAALRVAGDLFIAAFAKDAGLGLDGGGRAAVRAAAVGQARRYIDANVHQAELSTRGLIDALGLPRATLYRWFEHEGGIAAYICERKLRAAADEISKFPHLAVKDIAYGLGFNSASTFTRAFRRQYDMTPQDLRDHVGRMMAGEGGIKIVKSR
jgi:AraC-like DNA-binding protein